MSDRRGPRLPLIAGLAFFLAGLLLAGLAPTMALFVAGRARAGPRRRAADHRDVRRRRRGLPGAAAAAAVRRDLGGLGGAVAGRPGGRRRAGPAPELALGVPRAAAVRRGRRSPCCVPALRRLRRARPTRRRPGRAGGRSRCATPLGVAAVQWRRRLACAAGAARWSPGWRCSRWGCGRCCRPAPSRLRRGVPAAVALPRPARRRVLSVRVAGAADPDASLHGYGATAAGLPLTCRRAQLGGRRRGGRAGARTSPRHRWSGSASRSSRVAAARR